MKSWKLKYGLLVLVAGLWIFIGIKIYNTYFTAPKTIVSENSVMPISESKQEIVGDSFSLTLNYRDPFQASERKTVKQFKESVIPRKKATSKIVNWPVVEYTGSFVNRSTNEIKAIIKVNGSEYMVNKNHKVQSITVLNIKSKEILVSYEGEKKTINLNR
jgi:hypothetical protein